MIRLRQIKVQIGATKEDIIKKCSSKLKINVNQIKDIIIQKQSLDARKKDNLIYVYEIDVEVINEDKVLAKNNSQDIFKAPVEDYKFEKTGKIEIKERPVIVGAGPAGLFCGYMLASAGYKPIIIERGQKVEERIKTVEEFWKTGNLNTESNVQFGEGGAGTFSDGKLNTLIKDSSFRMKKVFEIFVEAGAPKEILYINKPHIGTDLLIEIVKNIRNKIIQMGGEIRYQACLKDIKIENNKLVQIKVNDDWQKCDVLVLAIGHSSRDTFKMLNNKKMQMVPKPFAVGVRVQHPQEMINKNQYGKNDLDLPAASYKLTYTTKKGRGVYSFCMCPGGYVVNSSSEKEKLVINGMSNHSRDSKNANSAVVVTVNTQDFGETLFGGLEFQEKLEKLAYRKGNGKIPVQLYGDFVKNKSSQGFKDVSPEIKGEYQFSNIKEILPEYISEALEEGIQNFDKKIKGFAREDSILAAIETRTSSPIRLERNDNGESSISGIFPAGEGAGYAGGITSSAIDGIKTAEKIASLFK